MLMPGLTYTRGLPGSGKTTWARNQLDIRARRGQRGQMARVNRDDLRAMLLDTEYGPPETEVEEIVSVAQAALIRVLLQRGISVIVDDTNLRDEYIQRLTRIAARCGVSSALVDFLQVPWEVCVARDTQRDRPVGAEVIRAMWLKHIKEGG